MFSTKIKNNEVYVDGIPWKKWTATDWTKWYENTRELLSVCVNIANDIATLTEQWRLKQKLKMQSQYR